MNQEMIDKMVTGSPLLDPRDAVSVAFRNYERYIAAPLKCVLDRDWKEEDLYAVAQIAANAITYRDREITNLKAENSALKAALPVPSTVSWYEKSTPKESHTPKPLAFQGFDNTPCTAELEVKLEKLANQFEEWHKEYKRDAGEDGGTSVFAQGKQDAYLTAARGLRALLNDK
jgi:hypothetical protein